MVESVKSSIILGAMRWDRRLAMAKELGSLPDIDEDQWRHAVDPYNSGGFSRRLAWDGLVDSRLATGVQSNEGENWSSYFDIFMQNDFNSESKSTLDNDVPFAHVLQPVVNRAWVLVQDADGNAGLKESARVELRQILLRHLSELGSSALGEMFSKGRTLADVAFERFSSGTLAGSTSEQYEEFCRSQIATNFEALFRAFPVLGRLWASAVENWVEATRELLERLDADRQDLQAIFGIPRDLPVKSFNGGLSDPHGGGRSVVIITFENSIRLVYKPRSVEIEACFQRFLAKLNSLASSGPLKVLSVLSRDDYGYVEHLTPKRVDNAIGLATFYANAGRLLAILYLLSATDCHWENLIAFDDQIVLIDAETLFEGNAISLSQNSNFEDSDASVDLMSDSVIQTGMLPSWISLGPERTLDVSALGAPGIRESSVIRDGWCFTNTDDMVWGEKRVEVTQPGCLPFEAGMSNPLADYGDELISGFDEMLAIFMTPEGRAIGREGIESFRGVRRRVVVRPTRTYVLLQRLALSPDALRHRDGRALELEKLSRAYALGDAKPKTWPLLHLEISALEGLDVPYFEGSVGSPNIVKDGIVVVDDYYRTEGMESALIRLDGLTDKVAQWQSRIIRGSIAAHRFEMATPTAQTSFPKRSNIDSKAIYAHDIARLIVADTIMQPYGTPTWLTVALLADATRVQLGMVPPSLYDGRAGIAAFLYDCGESDLADEVIRPVFEALDQSDNSSVFRYLRDIGMGITGVGGLLRLFRYQSDNSQLGPKWDDRTDNVINALNEDLLSSATTSDLVSGLAGLGAPIAARHIASPTEGSARRYVGKLCLRP